ncbi:hypothetical protein BU17DRAFT_81274 [Hysterangium stoloniferum]|nr:hypothetical protein BU17DRAFT_81274 [Hysterangium stoloniferum]
MSIPPNGNNDDMYRELYETTEELTEAARALNIAYDRLQDLRDSLNTIAARNRQAAARRRHLLMMAASEETATTTGPDTRRHLLMMAAEETATTTGPDTNPTMGPDHAALVFSDDDTDSTTGMPRLVDDDLPPRLIELSQHLRQEVLRISVRSSGGPSTAEASEAEVPRPPYVPSFRRRRTAQLPASSSNVILPPSSNSAARRNIIQSHLRQLQRASDPSEPSTTLGRRVIQRAAASAATLATAGSPSPSDTVVHSTIPLGLDIRPSPPTHPIESRAAAHLRHSFLPNPSTTRPSARFEPRQRSMRSNSLTAPTRPAVSSSTPDVPSVLTQPNTHAPPHSFQPTDDVPSRQGSHYVDTLHRSYRVRRLVNSSGEDEVMTINWRDVMSDQDLPDSRFTASPPLPPIQPPNIPGPPQPQSDTDESTIVNDATPGISAGTRDPRPTGQRIRRRGWARLDANGDEVSTEDEANLERSRLHEMRTAPRSHHLGLAGLAALADPLRIQQNQNQSLAEAQNAKWATTTQVLDMLFSPDHGVNANYVNPLPGRLAKKNREVEGEVWVRMDGDIVGR